MIKIEKKIETFMIANDYGYYFDVVTNTQSQMYEAWLYYESCDIKACMCKVPMKEIKYDNFVTMLLDPSVYSKYVKAYRSDFNPAEEDIDD